MISCMVVIIGIRIILHAYYPTYIRNEKYASWIGRDLLDNPGHKGVVEDSVEVLIESAR